MNKRRDRRPQTSRRRDCQHDTASGESVSPERVCTPRAFMNSLEEGDQTTPHLKRGLNLGPKLERGFVMNTQPSILASLLPAGSETTFLQDYYLRLPYFQRSACHEVGHLGDESVLARLFQLAAVDSIAAKDGVVSDSTNYQDLCSAGYTVGIRHAQRHDHGLRTLRLDSNKHFKRQLTFICTGRRRAVMDSVGTTTQKRFSSCRPKDPRLGGSRKTPSIRGP